VLISATSPSKSPAALIQVLYAAFVSIQKNLDSQTIDERVVDKLGLVAKQLIVVAKHHANVLFAQPQFNKTQYPSEVNWRFNFAIFCLLLAIRNKLDERPVLQLLKAAMLMRWQDAHFSPDSDSEQTTDTTFVMQKSLAAMFAVQGEHIVANLLTFTPNIMNPKLDHSSMVNVQALYQRIFLISGHLANLTLCAQPQKALSFSQALRFLCQRMPSAWLHILRPLMQYPSLLPTGTCIRDKHGLTSMVVAINDRGVWVKILATKTSDLPSAETRCVATSDIVHIYPPLKLTRFAQLDTWFDKPLYASSLNNEGIEATTIDAWPTRFAINKPPPSLIAFQHEMLGNNPDMKKMAMIIAREPSFVEQIQHSASINNRLRQLVETPLHGLLVNGLLPSNRMLWQHSLLSRLSQESFPLKHDLLMFCQLYCYIVEQLSASLSADDAQDVNMIALFSVGSLMLEPTLRHAIKWHVSPQHTFLFSQLHGEVQTQNANIIAIKLAKTWQQSPNVIKVLLNVERDTANFAHTNKADKISCILGLALMLGREVMFAEKTPCAMSIAFANYAQKRLELSQLDRTTLVEKCLAKMLLSCDLS
jgi:hypothetical protein